MVYVELRVLALQLAIDKRMIRYWFRLLSKHRSAHSYCIYKITLTFFCKRYIQNPLDMQSEKTYSATVDYHTCGKPIYTR